MNKIIAAGAVAASIAVGSLAGIVPGAPVLSAAAQTAGGAAGWVQDALGGLVDDGTITQEQADAVESALDEARPERDVRGHRGFRIHQSLSTVAETLGVTVPELRASLQDGQTIADVAADNDVEVQAVIDAIVTAKEERLAEKVAEGVITQEQADEVLAGAEERATALVNGDAPLFHRGPRGHGFGPGPEGTPGEGVEDAPDTSETGLA